jgi:ribosomal subunit interface protein
MKLPLQVSFQGLERSPALEAAIEERATKLDRFHPHIVSCRVTVTQETRHHVQGRPFGVRLDLTVPGKEIAVTKKEDEDAFVAVRDAFDAARRMLQDELAQRRGEVKQHAEAK